jgi:hypothetical protein
MSMRPLLQVLSSVPPLRVPRRTPHLLQFITLNPRSLHGVLAVPRIRSSAMQI